MKKIALTLPHEHKTKKTLTVKNLEPVSVKLTKLDDCNIEVINQIKITHGFHPNFDLIEHFSHIPAKKTLEEYYRQKSSQKEINNTFNILKKQIIAAIRLLKAMIKPLLKNGSSELTSLLANLNTIGKNNRDLITKNMTGEYKTLNQIRQSLDLLGNKNLLIILVSNLQQAILSIEEIQKNQKKPKLGRREGNKPLKDTILTLLSIYKQGTSQENVSCYYHPVDRYWCGDFHAFLSETLPHLGFKKINPEILGECARNIIDLDN